MKALIDNKFLHWLKIKHRTHDSVVSLKQPYHFIGHFTMLKSVRSQLVFTDTKYKIQNTYKNI